MYGAEPRYNDLQYNDNPNITICESGTPNEKIVTDITILLVS